MSLQEVKIKSKKSIGVLPVYDICVPGPHHYLLKSGIVSHNSGFIYASSIVVAMKKLKLKEDLAGNKVKEVNGIRAACKIMKTRYAKPFETVQVKIPYATGMSETSGLIDFFESKGVLIKVGNMLAYTSKKTSEITKAFRKNWSDEMLKEIMKEWDLEESKPTVTPAATDDIVDTDT